MIISKMWSHQVDAVEKLKNLNAAGLFFEMGCAKTLTAIALMEEWQARRVLVVCPKTVIDVWRREFEKHTTAWRPIILNQQSTLKKRDYLEEQLRYAAGAAVAIINYDSIWRAPLGKKIMALPWDVIVADESHRIKSPGGIASRYMARLGGKIPRRLALTGTPLSHSPLDAYGQYRYLDPSIFGWSFTRFRARYAILGGFSGKQVMKFINLEELHQKMYQIAMRVKATDVLDLPETMDETLTFDLSPGARKIYDSLEKDLMADLEDGKVISVPNTLAKLIRLQQLTGGWLLPDEASHPKRVDRGKADVLQDLLDGIGDEPVVIFCNFHGDLDACAEVCEKLGLNHAELSGRKREVQKFHDKEVQVLIAQIRSGGLGEDFTQSRYCIFYSTGWSLGDLEQARKRVHRPGQDRKVFYYHLCAARTVDQKVAKALEKRADLINFVIDEMRLT